MCKLVERRYLHGNWNDKGGRNKFNFWVTFTFLIEALNFPLH